MDFFHDHIDNQVAVPKMMMEPNGHSVPNSALYQCFVNIFHQLAAVGVHHTAGLRAILLIFITVIIMHSVKYFFSRDL